MVGKRYDKKKIYYFTLFIMRVGLYFYVKQIKIKLCANKHKRKDYLRSIHP